MLHITYKLYLTNAINIARHISLQASQYKIKLKYLTRNSGQKGGWFSLPTQVLHSF
jgi:hypothetical protein